jgi:hypothetical protein
LEDAAKVLGALSRKYRIAILTNGLKEVQRGRLARSNSAHEPQKVVVDYQALTHFEVHGRNARNKVPGKSHYGPHRAAG